MQPQSRFISHIVFLLGLALVIGCGKPVAPQPIVLPFSGTTIRIACPSGPARTLIDRHAAAWARLQKSTIDVIDVQDAGKGKPDSDVIVFVPAEMGRLVEGGVLAPLPESVTSIEPWLGQLRLYRNKMSLWGATPFALPILGDGTILIYRQDLFQAAKKRPPGTYADFAALAQHFFTERRRPVLPPLPIDDDGLDRLFFNVAAAFGVTPVGENDLRKRSDSELATAAPFAFHRDVKTGAPRLTDQGFVAALDWLKMVQPLRAKMGTLVNSFAGDDAVLGLGTLSELAALKPSLHPGRYGVAPIPAGPAGERIPYVGPGGAMVAVTKSAKNPAAALALAMYLSSQSVSLDVVHDPTFGSMPFRTAHLIDHRIGFFNYGLDTPGTTALIEAMRTQTEPRIVNSPIRLRTPDQAEYRAVLLDAVRKCLAVGSDSTSTLAEVDRKWRELDSAQPIDRRTMYLRSLTLTP